MRIITLTLTGLIVIGCATARAQQVAQSGSIDMPSTSPGPPPAIGQPMPPTGGGVMPSAPPPAQAMSCVTPNFSCSIGPGPIGTSCWCGSNIGPVAGTSR